MRGLLKAKKVSLSLSPTRQTDRQRSCFFINKVERVERVEVRCGYTVEVVQNYFNHAPQKNYVPFFRLIRWLEKARKQHTHKQLPTVPDKPAVVVRK